MFVDAAGEKGPATAGHALLPSTKASVVQSPVHRGISGSVCSRRDLGNMAQSVEKLPEFSMVLP